MYQDIDLNLCFPYLQEKWQIQNDELDKKTQFIYSARDFHNLIGYCDYFLDDNEEKSYAVHRWYNFVCSKACEEFAWEYGCKPCLNEKNNKTDFYIGNIPFDLKLSILPRDKDFGNLHTKQGKLELIKWYIDNQSKEQRKQKSNKIYVVVKDLWAKKDFAKIKPKIKTFMEYYQNHNFTKIIYNDFNNFCELIFVD